MALSQVDITTIQTVFGIKPEELSGALSSTEEVSLELKLPGKVYKPDEIETLKTASQDAGIEIGYKKVAKEAKINLEPGDKDPKIIAEKLKVSIETALEEKYKNRTPPEELATALLGKKTAEEKYEVLLNTHNTIKKELDAEKEKYKSLELENISKARDNEILSHFPEKMAQDRGDALLIVKNSLVSEEVDGVVHHKINGELVTDTLGHPATLKDAVNKLVEDKKWVAGSGTGEGDKKKLTGSMPTNLSDEKAMEYIEKQGENPMSTKGSQMMAELTKDFTE
jgi:hypothetical protein